MRLEPEKVAHRGTVIAHADGGTVFVHQALPGELVLAEPMGRRRGVNFARVESVIRSSPHRMEPACPHFGSCGGCHWQHADYPYQLELKRQVVTEAWQRAGLRLPPGTPIYGMEEPWRYRLRGDFEATYRSGELAIGLHRLRSHTVVPLKTCPIHDLRIEQAVLAFGQAGRELGLHGLANLHLTVEPQGRGILWRTRYQKRTEQAQDAALISRVTELLPDLTWLDDSMSFDFWGLHFRVRSDTFIQTNYAQMLVLYEQVKEMLAVRSEEAILDLYAGIGTISLALAGSAASVTAIEENPSAVQLGRLAMRINQIGEVHFLTGKVEEQLRRVKIGEHVAAVLDPPRAGCMPTALMELLRLSPPRVIYVSCEPSTHARDLALLVQGGYRVRRAALVDMFPQTYHVESVALLERPGS
ncbi:MAG: class I SAM-dependent RNA methyltransferase [Candidatus Dormibacteraceae bacterium]